MSTLTLPTAAPAAAPTTAGSASKTSRILSALPVLFLIFDAVIKLARTEIVAQSMQQLGYPAGAGVVIGVIEAVCIVLYLIPRTSVLGAVLLTGYLGGAIATHLRVGNPLASHVLFPLYIAAPLWAGLYLREPRLRALLPLRK
jgi:DoxX-like protein